jgi:hypothetical protein
MDLLTQLASHGYGADRLAQLHAEPSEESWQARIWSSLQTMHLGDLAVVKAQQDAAGRKNDGFPGSADDAQAHGRQVQVVGERARKVMSYYDALAFFSDIFDDMREVREGRPHRLPPGNKRILVLGRIAQLVRELEIVGQVGILIRAVQIEGRLDSLYSIHNTNLPFWVDSAQLMCVAGMGRVRAKTNHVAHLQNRSDSDLFWSIDHAQPPAGEVLPPSKAHRLRQAG